MDKANKTDPVGPRSVWVVWDYDDTFSGADGVQLVGVFPSGMDADAALQRLVKRFAAEHEAGRMRLYQLGLSVPPRLDKENLRGRLRIECIAVDSPEGGLEQ